ncbi:MAG: CotH kinase family protein, partial [Myxococcota bacterium]
MSAELDGFSSNLPLVIVDTLGRTDLDEAVEEREWRNIVLTVLDVDGTGRAGLDNTADYTGGAAIRIRGNSSVDYPKKQFSVELRDSMGQDTDASLLGMPAEEDWILHAPYSDKTLQRNVLMYALSNSISRYAARTRFVELFVCEGGETLSMSSYRGVYILMEKLKRDDNRIAIESLDPEDIAEPNVTGGYVVRRDWEPDEAEAIFTTSTYADVLELDYPKPERITPEQRAYITDYIDGFEQALSGGSFTD